jgi:hypothetical protein
MEENTDMIRATIAKLLLFELFNFSVMVVAKTSPWRPWRLGGSMTRNQPPSRQERQGIGEAN